MRDIYVILDNVRSAYNVGAIFRTAEGAGVTKIFLAGYTPAPQDRFGRVQSEIEKTSLGASEMVAWEAEDDTRSLIHRLQKEGVVVVAVELTPAAVLFRDVPVAEKVAYLFGNEIDGLTNELCEQCDYTLRLPMQGKKESLNVSVTAGIVLYHHLL